MAPKNKGKAGNSAASAPTKKKKGTRSTVSTNAQGKAKNNWKRQASHSDEGSSDDSSESSSDAPAQPKRKPRKRKKNIEVHEDIPAQTVLDEEVDDEVNQSPPEAGGNDNVSCYIYTLKLL